MYRAPFRITFHENTKEFTMKKAVIFWCIAFPLTLMSVSAEAFCVKVPQANIRSGPGTKHELIWEVYKYMPFEKVGESSSGQWFAVKDVDGDVNWINKNLITDSFRCAVVKKSQVNVRVGPGTRYRKTGSSPAHQYSSFRVVKRRGPWIKVKDEWGKVGWINKSFLWVR
jgi:SH3-like domain-containing protein